MTDETQHDTAAAHDEPVVALLTHQFAAARTLAAEVPDAEWGQATDLPGWTVQDCFSHMIGVERTMLGLSEEAPPVDHLPQASDDFSVMVEAPIELRRSRTPDEIRAELDETLTQRQAALEGFGPEKFEEDSWTPVGPGTYRDFMKIRAFDLWMHEQDVRHALDRPGHLSGPVAQSVISHNAAQALPMIVGKKAGAPVGSTVAINATGPAAATFVVQVNEVNGKVRAGLTEAPTADPTATITLAADTLMRLCGGRTDAAAVLEADPSAIAFDGDAKLGRAVVDNLAFTP